MGDIQFSGSHIHEVNDGLILWTGLEKATFVSMSSSSLDEIIARTEWPCVSNFATNSI